MPWHVEQRAGKFCVVKDNADGSNADVPGGCHATKEQATAMLRALYANEPSARATVLSVASDRLVRGAGAPVRVAQRHDIGQWILDGADGAIPWGDEGAFRACVDIVSGHVDDPEALCGWAKSQVGTATFGARVAARAFSREPDPTPYLAAQMAPLAEPYPTPAYVPHDWLLPSEFARSDRLTISDEGRVGGRFYQAGVCIIDGTDDCWEPPPSPSGYALFHQGSIVTDDGELRDLYVGAIGNVHGHASAFVDGSTAVAHYADPSAQLIVCRAYDDDRGGYIAGALVPGVTYGDVALLRRSALSGDWRSFRAGDRVGRVAAASGGYDCIGPTLVTRPGLPIIREIRAASAAPVYVGGMGGVPEPDAESESTRLATTEESTVSRVTLRDESGQTFTLDGVEVVPDGDGESITAAPFPPGDGGGPPDAPAEKGPAPTAEWAKSIEGRLDKIESALDELVANARAQVEGEVAALAAVPALPDPAAETA